MVVKRWVWFAVLGLACLSLAQKKVLDASAYDKWKSVRAISLSDDGKWVSYTIAPQDGDATVEVKATDGSKTFTLERIGAKSFTSDGQFFVGTVLPKQDEVKKAQRAKAKPEDQPKNNLLIMNLVSGERTTIERVTSFSMPEEDKGWILYKPEPPIAAPKPAAEVAKAELASKGGDAPKSDKKSDHKPGDVWVLRELKTGLEHKLEHVSGTRWSKDGATLIVALSTPDGKGDGIVLRNVRAGTTKPVVTALGRYPKFAYSDATGDVAFVTDKDDYKGKVPALSLYTYRAADGKLTKVDLEKATSAFQLSGSGTLQFSERGRRILFATTPKAGEEKKDDTPEDEKVSVDVWSWQDTTMMPQQLLQIASERSRTYDAMYDVSTGAVRQLESPLHRTVILSEKGDGAHALIVDSEPYRLQSSWGAGGTDYYLLDIQKGERKPLAGRFDGTLSFSPGGKYVYGYDGRGREFICFDVNSGERRSLSRSIKTPIWDEEDDHPDTPSSYGSAGWTAGDREVLIYDRYDIWIVDAATGEALNLTQGVGRSTSTVLRYLQTDPDQEWIDVGKPMLLSASNERTKASGFYTLRRGVLDRLLVEDKNFSRPVKAKGADVFAYQRMDTHEPADVWLADANFANARKVSDVNPQQKEYNWCTAELVSWLSNDGQTLQGLLYKPENFDGTKKYPMIAYFYERSSDGLHQYYSPAPSASTINIPMYCSNGYIVFVPDIPYKVGYPGESAVSAIMPGVQSIVARGFVDPKRLGLQGQSWGGYQVGYLVTESNLFAAACAGAPVSNMVSAYGGIRWGSGVTREGQYEKGQSRIGGSLWENPMRFWENSPIFFVDKVKTPLLIMSNDKDGAVPWYQGIEFFSALRRLSKPAWLVVYNNEDHNLVQRKNRKDWSIRMQQFFDHYLKGAPMPVWMANGIPAVQKGKTYGFDLVPGTEPKPKSGN